jgi:hypothetical protein
MTTEDDTNADGSLMVVGKAILAALGFRVAKEQPGAGDVHVAANGKDKKRKLPTAAEGDDVAKTEPAEFETTMIVSKVVEDKMQVFGWASVSSVNGQDIIDKQGDIIPIAELEKAAYDYVLYSREQGDMHSKRNVGRLIESFVFTPEKASAGFIAKDENGHPMMGWAVGFQVTDKDVWKEIRGGGRPEFSIGGKATAVPQ